MGAVWTTSPSIGTEVLVTLKSSFNLLPDHPRGGSVSGHSQDRRRSEKLEK